MDDMGLRSRVIGPLRKAVSLPREPISGGRGLKGMRLMKVDCLLDGKIRVGMTGAFCVSMVVQMKFRLFRICLRFVGGEESVFHCRMKYKLTRFFENLVATRNNLVWLYPEIAIQVSVPIFCIMKSTVVSVLTLRIAGNRSLFRP